MTAESAKGSVQPFEVFHSAEFEWLHTRTNINFWNNAEWLSPNSAGVTSGPLPTFAYYFNFH